MSDNQISKLQDLLNRLQQGDASARDELIECAFEPLHRLARRILHTDFGKLRNAHDTSSALNEGSLRLWQSLQKVQPPTVRDFFRLAGEQIRRVLLNWAARDKNFVPLGPENEPEARSAGPGKQAEWTELLQKVETLPEPEREVFTLICIQGLSGVEVARLLGVDPRRVAERLASARQMLGKWLRE